MMRVRYKDVNVEFSKMHAGCMECGKDRQCSNFNHVLLLHWQMFICRECYKTYYEWMEVQE